MNFKNMFFCKGITKVLKRLKNMFFHKQQDEQQVAVMVDVDGDFYLEESRSIEDDTNSDITVIDKENNDIIEIVVENRKDENTLGQLTR